MKLSPSELILNPDGSIYHLNLQPNDIADTIITVGDPDRVAEVSSYFDTIEIKKRKREFHTHTGTFKGKRLTVISTGIGTDNIDIVLNELDALVNIDFESRTINSRTKRLDIIRIGTSGAIQSDIPVDTFLMSEYALGFDGLMHFYNHDGVLNDKLARAFVQHCDWPRLRAAPYAVNYDEKLGGTLKSNRIRLGLTITNTGFYGPQGRKLRLEPKDGEMLSKMTSFQHEGMKVTNLEMETSGIYALSGLLGHRAVSMNCILANRVTGEFSKNPKKAISELIQYCLEKICS